MSFLQDLKRRVIGLPKADRMNLPTEREINPEGNSYDGQKAVDHFLGKTQEQITRELATRLHWYFYEDFLWMGCRAFCFYFPAVADYVTTAEAKEEDQVVENFCGVIESRLKCDFVEIREAFPAIVHFAEYVLTHFGDYGYEPEDEELRQRLRTIKQRCAVTAPNSGASAQFGASGGPERPPSVS